MARFTLVVRPDGKAILASRERLTDSAKAELVAQLRAWEEGPWPIAIVDGCDVVSVSEIEIALDEPVAV